MSTALMLTRDQNNQPILSSEIGLKFSDINQYFVLTANVVTSVTVPVNNSPIYGTDKFVAIIRYGNPTGGLSQVLVQPSASPLLVFPTGVVTATKATLSPGSREVVPGQVLQFLTSQANIVVSISYYAIQG